MTIQIENGIPTPKSQRGIKRLDDPYPFEHMKIGDSFFIETANRSHLGMPIARAQKKFGFRFRTSSTGANVHGVRCWRIA